MPSLRRVMEPTWTYDSLTTLTGGHTPPQLGQRGGWNGVRHGHRGIITHHKWPQVFRVTAVLDKSAAIPGVQSAAIASLIPLDSDSEIPYWPGTGPQPPQNRTSSAMFYIVTPDY